MTNDLALSRELTEAERSYVFGHLAQQVSADVPLEMLVSMPSSAGPLCLDFCIGNVPVLFPVGDSLVPFEERNGHVVFCHDLVKSAFYLLSGYQEHVSGVRDSWGRFPYEQSVQAKLGSIHQATVNHYFSWIIEGVEQECRLRGIACRRLHPFGGASLLLTHDIDMVRYFTWRKSLFRLAQVVGLRKCDTNRWRLAKAAGRSLLRMAGLRHDEDVYWSFRKIQDNEAYLGYRSAWFFLPNDGGPFPPDYDVETDADVRGVMEQLASRGNLVGLHSPIKCKDANSYACMMDKVRNGLSGALPIGRQHFLAVDGVAQLRAMQEAGLRVDFSLGFSAHEGFRNAYCMPFHPFDHEKQQMMSLWEVPLAMMDTTVFAHRGLSDDDVYLALGEMLDEVRQFQGVFSLLWHNSTFDDVYRPGIFKFYEDLHSMFTQYGLADFSAHVEEWASAE